MEATPNKALIGHIIEMHISFGWSFTKLSHLYNLSTDAIYAFVKQHYYGHVAGPTEVIVKQSKANTNTDQLY